MPHNVTIASYLTSAQGELLPITRSMYRWTLDRPGAKSSRCMTVMFGSGSRRGAAPRLESSEAKDRFLVHSCPECEMLVACH